MIPPIPASWLGHAAATGVAAYEEVEGEITNKLFEPRMQPAVREYLTKLRSDAFLEIRDGYVDSAAAAGKSSFE